MYKLVEQMKSGVSIPLLHIADASAEQITNLVFKSPSLMATVLTMERSFYIERLNAAARYRREIKQWAWSASGGEGGKQFDGGLNSKGRSCMCLASAGKIVA